MDGSLVANALWVLPAGFLLWIGPLYYRYRRSLASVGNTPGTRSFIGYSSYLYHMLPHSASFNRQAPEWDDKHKIYEQSGQDIISHAMLYPKADVVLMIADADVIKDITMNRAAFPKPVSEYRLLDLYGANIVVTEDDEWRKHRKVSAPAFSERNNIMVHAETTQIVLELFEIWKQEGQAETVIVPDMGEVTFELALQVISAAGFGNKIQWKDEDEIPAGHAMTFKRALGISCRSLAERVGLSDFFIKLVKGKEGKDIITAFKELQEYMHEWVQARTAEVGDGAGRADLFTSIIRGNLEGSEKGALTDQEVVGNLFIFLVAGHETTAHNLGFTFALLALYPEIQQKLYEEIARIVPRGKLPTYEDVSKMKYALAVIYETLRLFPIVNSFLKMPAKDTVFHTTTTDGKKIAVPAPAGTSLHISVIGLHYNPKYWKDPYEFNPDRFMGQYNKDAFIPFAVGPRACLGRRFAEIEALTALSLFIQHYELTVTERPEFSGETVEQRRERVLKTKTSLTLTPAEVPLTLKRRPLSQ